ncbi:uncharacterized protein [Nicotiana sylvestris]|uniref:uncharacterized protein n=1 Tax=Nicotiana sylvestris TaxID=4096 RepID=UPI00388C4C35
MRSARAGEEDTSKPGKVKKRKKDATISTSAAMASPRTEDEGEDDDAWPLVQRARRGKDAPQATRREAAESGVADLGQTYAEETLEEGSGTVLKSQVGHGTVRADEPAIGNSKGLEPEASRGLRRCMTMPSLGSKIGQKDAIVGRLQEEATVKDAEILELRGQNEVMASKRDILRSELASTWDLLQSARKEATALSAAKYEAEKDASSYRKHAATANERAREILEKAKQKLDRAVAHARAEARRQAFEEASAKGADLSTEIEEARDLEEELAFSATSDEGFGDDLEYSDGEE